MPDSLKNKTVKGVSWSFAEQLLTRASNFVIGIVLARILSPTDYGLIGMLGLFLAVSQLFIDGGLTSALIRTKNPSEKDFSTVYLINIGLSILFYFLLFFCAPLIANFYQQPILIQMIRIIALILIISAVSSVQNTLLTIKVDFKTKTYISIISAVVSGAAGIVCAYNGWGVWALVAQSLASAITGSAMSLLFVRWIPRPVFSIESFRRLFSYSSKFLVANCINVFYGNSHSLVIGKLFSPADVGQYTRGGQFPGIVDSTITTALNKVAFPVLSQIQDDDERLIRGYEKYIQLSCFLIFPTMMGLCGCARPIVQILLKEQWLTCVPLMQILCFEKMAYGISTINLNLLYVKGRSDLVLKLEIIKKTIAFSILFITMSFGLKAMCYGQVVYAFIAFYLNTHYTKIFWGYSFSRQIKVIAPYFLISLIVLTISTASSMLIDHALVSLFVALSLCGFLYFILARKANVPAYQEIRSLIRENFHL